MILKILAFQSGDLAFQSGHFGLANSHASSIDGTETSGRRPTGISTRRPQRRVKRLSNVVFGRARIEGRSRWLLYDIGLQRSPLPEIFTGLVGDPIADIGCRLKVTDVLGWGVWPISLGVPRPVFALLGF